MCLLCMCVCVLICVCKLVCACVGLSVLSPHISQCCLFSVCTLSAGWWVPPGQHASSPWDSAESFPWYNSQTFRNSTQPWNALSFLLSRSRQDKMPQNLKNAGLFCFSLSGREARGIGGENRPRRLINPSRGTERTQKPICYRKLLVL